MKFLSILKWMIGITLVVALVAGGAGLYFWNHSDEFIQKEILSRFASAAPDLKLVVGSTKLRGTQGVSLRNIEIRERTSDRPLLRVRELEVLIDSTMLIERQLVSVNEIRLKSADILLARDENGGWNWQKYSFIKPETAMLGLPQISVEDLRIQLTLKHGNGIPPARLLLTSPQIQAVPASQHSYDFAGGVTLPSVGVLNLTGMADLASQEWNLGGQLRGVQADQQLMEVATAATPGIKGKLANIDDAIERLLPQGAAKNQRQTGAALMIGTDASIAPQFVGTLDVDFNMSSSAESAIPEFRLKVAVKDGRIASKALPMVLTDVNAAFYKDNTNLIFRLDQARGDGASLSGGFQSTSGAEAKPGRAWVKLDRFPVSMQLVPLLPTPTKRLFENFQPDGIVSATAELNQQPDGSWRPENINATVHEGTLLYHKFKYPTKLLGGTVKQRANAGAEATAPPITKQDVVLDVDVNGVVGDHPFRVTGWMKNPGPAAETRFQTGLTDFPLDSRFRNALLPAHQDVVNSLNLTGFSNVDFVFYRAPGLDQPTVPFIDARVFDARMRFTKFPYDIDTLSGHLTFNGATKRWKFLELNGQHDGGKLSAKGNFRMEPKPGVLDLTIDGRGVPINSDLYNALTATQRTLWNMIDPEGFCDLTAKVDWTALPGQPAIVRFPVETPVRIFNTRIRPQSFPYDMQVTEAILSFDPNDPRFAGVQHCEIHSFRAMHEDSPIQATGWAESKPDGEWQVHFNDLTAQRLKPDDHLRAALPVSWHETMERMHKMGTVSIEKSEMDFRGVTSGDKNTTARWDMKLRFNDCTLNAGLDVSEVYGLVTATGVWDGFQLQNVGNIHLDTAEVLEMPFTNVRGPYSLNNIELVLGSRQVFETNQLSSVDGNSRLKAQAYGGELFLDALVDIREEGRYWFFTELTRARLESYAARHIPDQLNLRGVVNAWMSLGGVGDDPANIKGRGQLMISPAALYELPVIVKLLGSLSQLNLNVQNLTAFNYAMLTFKVEDEAFQLEPVDLVGESISFRGEGQVGFSGAVDLDFYSRPPRSSLAALPFINGFLTNWAKIEVRGTTAQPQTMVKSAAKVDERLRQFLQPFNPNPRGPTPMLTVPRVFQRSNSPFLPRLQPQAAGAKAQQQQ